MIEIGLEKRSACVFEVQGVAMALHSYLARRAGHSGRAGRSGRADLFRAGLGGQPVLVILPVGGPGSPRSAFLSGHARRRRPGETRRYASHRYRKDARHRPVERDTKTQYGLPRLMTRNY